MQRVVDTKDPTAVEYEVQLIFRSMFPGADRLIVPRAFGWAIDCFTGKYENYQAVDAHYHDFEHTLQGTLCMMRLLEGRHRAGVEPVLSKSLFELGMLAILLHDTGYLKKKGDVDGTGAKYTLFHVARSAEFAEHLLASKGFTKNEIASVQHMIRCTGVNADLSAIPFQSDIERIVGFALSTADLLGQMAADDYIEKLPILYQEFAEAASYHQGQAVPLMIFSGPEDLLRKTPAFWEKYVRPKITNDFQGLYRFLNDPYPDGPNFYLERASANIERLRQEMSVPSA